MFFKKSVFISYFCCDEAGKIYFGNTSAFKASKVTPDFLSYVELKLKDSLGVKELTVLSWKFY